jgi:hypothetical protein
MKDSELDSKKIIFLYLSNPIGNNSSFKSGFIKVLHEARVLTGRDENTVKKILTTMMKMKVGLESPVTWFF